MSSFSRNSRIWSAMALILIAGLLAGSAKAQLRGRSAGKSRVSGTVTDTEGNPLVGVTLFLNSTETKTKSTKVKTNKKGTFIHPLVSHGPYKFEFVKEGYKVYYLEMSSKASDDADMGSFGPAHFSMAQAEREIRLAIGGVTIFTVRMAVPEKYDELAMAAAMGSMPEAEISEKVIRTRHPAEVGREMFDVKNYAGALEQFEEAVALRDGGQDAGLAFAMAQSYYHLDRPDEAGAQLRRVQELDRGKHRAGVSYFQSLVAQKQGRTQDAVIYMEKEVDGSDDPQASMLSTLGGLYRDVGEDEKAIASFERSLEKDAGNLGALMNLGGLYNGMGNQKKAEEYFQRAAKAGASQGKKGAAIFFNIGAISANDGKSQAAVDAFERAIAINPKYAAAHRELGYTYRELHNTGKAREHFQTYLKLQSKAPDRPELELWLKATK